MVDKTLVIQPALREYFTVEEPDIQWYFLETYKECPVYVSEEGAFCTAVHEHVIHAGDMSRLKRVIDGFNSPMTHSLPVMTLDWTEEFVPMTIIRVEPSQDPEDDECLVFYADYTHSRETLPLRHYYKFDQLIINEVKEIETQLETLYERKRLATARAEKIKIEV